jgi:CO dehydrogenase maturation factor
VEVTFRIAVAGKGGTGKTTFSTLMVRYLAEKGKIPILAIDADPNSCLGTMLGTDRCQTIGDLREELLRDKDDLPAGISKPQYVEMKIRTAMAEEDDFDLLVMGRPEGTGCYCYVNSVLRTFMDNLGEGYAYVVMDNEAGLEHLSRRTTNDVDVMFLISDPSRIGIESAARVMELAQEMELNVKAFHLVISRSTDVDVLRPIAEEFGFADVNTVPMDPKLAEASLKGLTLMDLDSRAKSYRAVQEIAKRHVPGM